MRKNFTRFVCVGIASFCMMAVFGQEKIPAVKNIFDEKSIRKLNEVELRADEGTEYWWPDSVIYYDADGEPYSKDYYDLEKRTATSTSEYDDWSLSEPQSTDGYFFMKQTVTFYKYSGKLTFSLTALNWFIWWNYADGEYNTVSDTKGNLILIDIKGVPDNNGNDNFIEYRIQYNENNEPALIERYNYDRFKQVYQYEYNEKGNPTLFQTKYIDNNGLPIITDYDYKITAKYDEGRKPLGIYMFYGSTSQGKWLLNEYVLFYYSDKTNTPNVAVENNNPIGSNNQGNFDLNVNLPTDSIGNGSITITFPEGFTLDTKNTKLTVDFTALFTLTVTKQENYSWLLEIKPKTLRSASLRAGEAKKMLQVAYTVDAKKKKGTYDISVNSILFETKSGNYYPEPAITVPAVVNRWGVGIETVENESVWTSGGNLYVRTAKACTVSVYTLPGQLIRQQAVGAGETAIPLPQGIYFVKTGGITRKIFVR